MEVLISSLLAVLIGVVFGTITGLTPGIHINMVAALFLSIFLIKQQTTFSIIFIVAMAITHTFVDFIPSIFLGAPDEDTGLATLPGHKFLIAGKGYEAVRLTFMGSLLATIILLIILPPFFFLVQKIYPFVERMLAWILIWICFFLIYNEKKYKLNAFIIFILSGFLGIASLNIEMNQPLLPLLTGLFGSSTIIYSIKSKTKIPKQQIKFKKVPKRELIKPAIITTLVSPICSFFPGLGSSQAAILGSEILGELTKKQFLILLGSINTLVMEISFATLFLIGKSRTGMAEAISQITRTTPKIFLIIILTILASSIISFFIAIYFAKIFAKNISKVNYSKISLLVLVVLCLIIFLFSGFIGFIVFLVSTMLGLLCIELQTRKGFLMGALLIPTILFYLPF